MIVSAENCPPLDGAAYWERSQDPFHVDAFPTEADITGPGISTGVRASGWMAIDWSENPIAFVADGAEYEDDETQYIRYKGFAGHIVCVPRNASYLSDLIDRHMEYERTKVRKQSRPRFIQWMQRLFS